jgi:zinc transport system substrate-binding protein
MKKFLLVAFAACWVLLMAAPLCAAAQGESHKLQITTTIFPPYDFVRALGGDKVEVNMLLRPGAESHSFEPSPQDIIKIKNSDIFIYVGGESEAWVEQVLETIDSPQLRIIALMDCVSPVTEEIVAGMQSEEEEGEEGEEEYDEHVWTSPANAGLIVQAIAEILSDADAGNAAFYQQNARAYLEELKALDLTFKQIVAKGVRKIIVFGDRFPFRYLTMAYGLQYFAAFPGCSTDTEVSAATMAFLIDKVKSEKIPVVFHIELSNEKIADAICEASGAQKLLMHSGHNLSRADFAKGVTYLELMRANTRALAQALD